MKHLSLLTILLISISFNVLSQNNTFINNGENVGIGHTNPTYGKLQIQHEGNQYGNEWYRHGIQVIGNDQVLTMGVESDDHVAYLQSFDRGTSTSALLLNPKGGNVMIGRHTNSGYSFDVTGWSRLRDRVILNKTVLSPTGHMELGINAYSGTASVGTVPYLDFHFGTGNLQDFNVRIINNYDKALSLKATQVGIGTNFNKQLYADADDATLLVDGKVVCEEMEVELSQNWGDFVFAQDYELESLKEVEEYIEENNHLPGIPSAEEIEEEGLVVGEMIRLQMIKIEELTLHMIELKKENEELKETVESLTK